MINLNKFIEEKEIIVPILEGKFQYNRKKYKVSSNNIGWFKVEISSNNAKIIEEVNIGNIFKFDNSIRGYTYYNNIIFANFDQAKRKLGAKIMLPFYFNKSDTFSPILVIIWEDKNLYYYMENYANFHCYNLKNFFNQNLSIETLKGLTPELKTVYLFHQIEKLNLIKLQKEIKKQKELDEFKKTLKGRLLLAFNSVEAKILNYKETKNATIEIDWKLPSGDEFNSIIDTNTFQVLEAGYCMSGHDKEHNISSLVELAKDYEERNLIYKTRT